MPCKRKIFLLESNYYMIKHNFLFFVEQKRNFKNNEIKKSYCLLYYYMVKRNF